MRNPKATGLFVNTAVPTEDINEVLSEAIKRQNDGLDITLHTVLTHLLTLSLQRAIGSGAISSTGIEYEIGASLLAYDMAEDALMQNQMEHLIPNCFYMDKSIFHKTVAQLGKRAIHDSEIKDGGILYLPGSDV